MKNIHRLFFSSNSGKLPIPHDRQRKNMVREKKKQLEKKEERGRGERDKGREMPHNSTKKAIISRLQLIFYLCANWK